MQVIGSRPISQSCIMALLGDVAVTAPASVLIYDEEPAAACRKSAREVREFIRLLEHGPAEERAKEVLHWFKFFPDDLCKARKAVEQNRLQRVRKARMKEEAREERNDRRRAKYHQQTPEQHQERRDKRQARRQRIQAQQGQQQGDQGQQQGQD